MPNKRKKILYILAGLGIYLLATGISYGAFTALARGSIFTSPLPAGQEEGEESADRKALIDITGPKNETCLLNGAKFTKAEKNVWETRRPLAVMIENHEESRPQSLRYCLRGYCRRRHHPLHGSLLLPGRRLRVDLGPGPKRPDLFLRLGFGIQLSFVRPRRRRQHSRPGQRFGPNHHLRLERGQRPKPILHRFSHFLA